MSTDYERITRAIHFVRERKAAPSLEEVGRAIDLSPHHAQRLFRRWAGVSPARFHQHLVALEAGEQLARGASNLEASEAVGLSGSGRLHDLWLSFEGMSPGEWKRQARGLRITWGLSDSPFGPCFVASTDRGICAVEFQAVNPADRWPQAELVHDDRLATELVDQLGQSTRSERSLLAIGTPFQLQVWRALLELPLGSAASYRDVASAIGKPSAVRAVASAIGANPLAWLIPCHRVIRATGELGEYRYGSDRKRALLLNEACRPRTATYPRRDSRGAKGHPDRAGARSAQ